MPPDGMEGAVGFRPHHNLVILPGRSLGFPPRGFATRMVCGRDEITVRTSERIYMQFTQAGTDYAIIRAMQIIFAMKGAFAP